MNPLSSFTGESLLEQGASFAKKTTHVTTNGVKVTAQTAAAQLTGTTFGDSHSQTSTDQSADTHSADHTQFVRELYGVDHAQSTNTDPSQLSPQAASAPKTQEINNEEQQKLAITRQQLNSLIKQQHMDSYFNPTFNNKGKAQEESVTEKHEREEQVTRFEEFEKQKKKPDFALQRAKTRTEMSPGASG